MNRILFERGEITDGVATFGGARAEHILGVLHGEVGQVLKTGEVDGMIGTGEIVEIIRGEEGLQMKVSVCHDRQSLRPWVDLVIAPPRPRVMKRLLPQLAAMGVGRIVLVGAKKVEKDFWGATLLKEETYRPLLIDGLMQAGTSILPEVVVRRAFRKFLAEELDVMLAEGRRIVAHPYGADRKDESASPSRPRRVVLAVGPEGGWTDDEVELLESKGFERYSLGARILRTDTATIALLARLMEEVS